MDSLPEVWLRGPVSGIPLLLQPVAHALLQSQEEIGRYTNDFSDQLLWVKVAETASAGFHLQHIKGVLDRLFTYAQNKQLTDVQLNYLKMEGVPDHRVTVKQLVDAINKQIEDSVSFLKDIDPVFLASARDVGRNRLPSTLLGLLFHAAEHTQRHVGQLYVTIRVVGGTLAVADN